MVLGGTQVHPSGADGLDLMARALVLIGLMQLLTLLVGVVRQKGLSVFFGPEGLGIVGTIDQIILLVIQLGAFGLPFTALKFMSQAHGAGPAAFQQTSNGFLRLIGLLSIAATAGCMLIVAIAPQVAGQELAPYSSSLLIAFLGIAPLMMSALLVNVLASARRPLAGSAVGLVVAAVSAAGAFAGAAMAGTIGLYLGSSAAGLVATAGALVYLNAKEQISPFRPGRAIPEPQGTNSSLRTTALAVYITMIAYTGSLLAVRYGVLAVAGEREVGILHAALTVALTSGSLLAAMSGLYLAPTLNRLKDPAEKLAHAHIFTGRMLALFMLGAVPLALFPQLAMTILYTHHFHPSAALIAGFLVWQCLYQYMNVYQQLLIGLDEMPYMAFAASSGLCVATALSIALASWFGSGLVWLALTLGAVLACFLMIMRLRLKYGMRVPAYIIVRVVLVLGTMAITKIWFDPADERTLYGITTRITFAVAAFGLLLLQMKDDERALLTIVLKTARRRLGLAT